MAEKVPPKTSRKRPLPPGIRLLPSGLFQATVWHPSGKRITKTDKLMTVVKQWRTDEMAKYARGDLRDPRSGRITVGEWYARWYAARGFEAVTKDKVSSNWRTHCETKWGTWPMEAITRLEAQEWANVLRLKRRARHRGKEADADAPTIAAATVHAVVHVMSGLFDAALKERPPIVVSNPFVDLDLPVVPPSPIDFYTHDEADALLAVLDAEFAPQWSALVGCGMWMGLRPGEIFGLHGDRVNWLRDSVEVTRVLTRHGMREYPKSTKSHRTVPVPEWQMPKLRGLMTGRDITSAVFTAPLGGLVDDTDFRLRIWYPAIGKAGVRRFAPRVMRHTAASWLVQDGVPLYDVQALLGHESFATTQRYAHLRPGAHDKVVQSWRQAQHRTAGHGGDYDACARCQRATG